MKIRLGSIHSILYVSSLFLSFDTITAGGTSTSTSASASSSTTASPSRHSHSIKYKSSSNMSAPATSTATATATASVSPQRQILGQTFVNRQARKAYVDKELRTKIPTCADTEENLANAKIRVVFMNQTEQPLILCWVDERGKLYHYYKLEPSSPIISSLDRNGMQINHRGTHLENTQAGHAFVLGLLPDTKSTFANAKANVNANASASANANAGSRDTVRAANLASRSPSTNQRREKEAASKSDKRIGRIIAGYRPSRPFVSSPSSSSSSPSSSSNSEGRCVHLVTISSSGMGIGTEVEVDEGCTGGWGWGCFPFKRRRKSARARTNHNGDLNSFRVTVRQCEMDITPLDTTKKVYRDMIIGGWRCKCEQGLFVTNNSNSNSNSNSNKDDEEMQKISKVKEQLERDLLVCSQKLPKEACKLLKQSTLIWINKCQKYGPKCAPVVGRGMCFHPGSGWLIENGMSSDKCGGVELYEAGRYLDDHSLWHGEGGVMLHELSHAWHNKFTTNGYDNEEIRACYERAMEEKLYECVEVHDHGQYDHNNKKGGKLERKAYAATDPMEFFAELSVAFLGGVGEDKDVEFNKWFPFNRRQLKDHDPRAYRMLQKMWRLELAEGEDVDEPKCTSSVVSEEAYK